MKKVTANSYREYRVSVPTATAVALKALAKEHKTTEHALIGTLLGMGYEAWVAKLELDEARAKADSIPFLDDSPEEVALAA